jgi:hypothetical protein
MATSAVRAALGVPAAASAAPARAAAHARAAGFSRGASAPALAARLHAAAPPARLRAGAGAQRGLRVFAVQFLRDLMGGCVHVTAVRRWWRQALATTILRVWLRAGWRVRCSLPRTRETCCTSVRHAYVAARWLHGRGTLPQIRVTPHERAPLCG